MFGRIGLFLITNILIMVVVSIIISVFGLDGYMTPYGINYQSLLIYCFIWGSVGSVISLLSSKWMAKRSMGLKPLSTTGEGAEMVRKVHQMAKRSGITKMPEVFIFDSPQVNAFATGPTKNNSLVAVSTGLINSMSEEEVDAVLAHEVSHIANGDMVTMALVQGVVNAFVLFFARVISHFISQAMRGDGERRGGGLGFGGHFIYMGLQMALGFLATPLVMWFSRWREYRADAGSARLVGKEPMINALKALQRNYQNIQPLPEKVAALSISNKASFKELFSSHPPLTKRIRALENFRK